MVNQVMYFLGMGPDKNGARSTAQKHQMVLQAYDATGNKWYDDESKQSPSEDIMHGPLTTEVSTSHSKSTVQVALKWLTDMGIPVMVKSHNPVHMRDNLDLFNWTYSPEEQQRLDAHQVAIPHNPVDFCGATDDQIVV